MKIVGPSEGMGVEARFRINVSKHCAIGDDLNANEWHFQSLRITVLSAQRRSGGAAPAVRPWWKSRPTNWTIKETGAERDDRSRIMWPSTPDLVPESQIWFRRPWSGSAHGDHRLLFPTNRPNPISGEKVQRTCFWGHRSGTVLPTMFPNWIWD